MNTKINLPLLVIKTSNVPINDDIKNLVKMESRHENLADRTIPALIVPLRNVGKKNGTRKSHVGIAINCPHSKGGIPEGLQGT